jgi:ATP-dependent DNA ligase
LVLHAPSDFDPTDWLISENFDGMRSVWSAKQRQFYSRLGNKISLPQWIGDCMPGGIWLDGEFWIEHQTQVEAIKITHTSNNMKKVKWEHFKYLVFEKPFDDECYVRKWEVLKSYFASGSTFSRYL